MNKIWTVDTLLVKHKNHNNPIDVSHGNCMCSNSIESPSYTKCFADDAIGCNYILQWINIHKNISVCLFGVFIKGCQVIHKQMFMTWYDATFCKMLLLNDWRNIFQNLASLTILVHDVINLYIVYNELIFSWNQENQAPAGQYLASLNLV